MSQALLNAQARDILRGHPTITISGSGTTHEVLDSIQASYDRAALDTRVVRFAATIPKSLLLSARPNGLDLRRVGLAARGSRTVAGEVWR